VSRQLTLDLGTPPPATFDNFIMSDENDELVTRLQKLDLALAAGPVPDRSFYIWGEPGSGRTHLLQALVSDASYGYARYLTPQSPLGAFTFDPRIGIYAIDDCDRMSDTQQVALFNLFNEVRAHPSSAFVAAGPAAPLALDVRDASWGIESADAIVCINMIHISPWASAQALIGGAGRLLPPGGVLFLYGPYRRGGAHTAPSNAAFDEQLRRRDPAWGVRDLEDVAALADAAGFDHEETVAMPANNFSVVFRKR